jgi:hypothetical protein
VKQYEYRLVSIMFDDKGNLIRRPDAKIHGLQPDERIFETTGKPEYHPNTGQWSLPVLTEREFTCFPIPSSTDLEELTARLKGEFK